MSTTNIILHQHEDGGLQLRDNNKFLFCECGARAVEEVHVCINHRPRNTAQRIQALEEANRFMQEALEMVIKNDKTVYRHHEKRPFDAKAPAESGGTIWRTPKEIAYNTFEKLGIRPPCGTD